MPVPLHLIESTPLSSNIWNIKKEAWLCFWKQGNKLLTTESIVSVGVSTHSAGLKKRMWLCVMKSYASPAVPLLLIESDGSTRNKNTGERDSILYGNMPLNALRPCLWPLTVPRTSTPLSVHNSCCCLVQNHGCIHFTTDANKRHWCPEPTHPHVPTNETTRRQCNA